MKTFFKIILATGIIYFGSWFLVYNRGINSLAIQSEDTLPAIFLPVTILREGTIYLDSYVPMMMEKYPHPDDKSYEKGLVPFYLRKVGEHYVSAFPIITPLLAVPVYAVALLFDPKITWDLLIILSHISSALIVAFSGALLYKLLNEFFFLESQKAKILTIIYLFGTINYALISQALWQHGTLQLLLIFFVYSLLTYQRNQSILSGIFTGLFAGLAILSRPTAFLVVGLFCLYILFTNIRILKKLLFIIFFLVGFAPSVLFFFWYNNTYYQDIRNQGYSDQLVKNWLSPFPQSFAGVWVSPSKGILIYSPIFLFSLLSPLFFAKSKSTYKAFYVFAFIAVLFHTLIMSFWKHWYGGWSFGYRMSSDVIPILILLLVPVLNSDSFFKVRKLFNLFIALSIFVQLSGIAFYDGIWHAAYDKGFVNTSWLWSLRDSEAVFNVRRVLVKSGYLQSPF